MENINAVLCAVLCVTLLNCGCLHSANSRKNVVSESAVLICSRARIQSCGAWGVHRLELIVKNVSDQRLLMSKSLVSAVTYSSRFSPESGLQRQENLHCFARQDDDFMTIHPHDEIVVSGLFNEESSNEIINCGECDVVVEFKTTAGDSKRLRTKVFPDIVN